MADVTINQTGVAELERQLADGMFAVVEEVLARSHPPRRTGKLADSGHAAVFLHGRVVRGDAPSRVEGIDDDIVGFAYYSDPIAHLIERGTVNMTARPFLGPAAMSVEPEVGQIMAGHMRTEV